MKKVSIGGGQGFWGDSNDAAVHMVKNANLNYLACDYLAELTLSIMQKQKLKNPNAGYAKDFVALYQAIAKDCAEKGITILTNAGGMNITGAVNEIEKVAQAQNLKGLKIGYVLGDDLKDKIPELMAQGIEFKNMDNDENFRDVLDKIVNVNVYHGHEPILECLNRDAKLVITGRATDSSLFLSPLMKEFGWATDDYNNLAKGIMAGHLLECGGQGSGGNYDYDWRNVPDLDQLGFPIAELTENDFHITKAPDCGGLVTEQSCKEQILYEIHDPANYYTPDVIADISNATLTQAGKDRVKVGGIKGKKPTDQLKLCVGYHAGYKLVTYYAYAWPDAYEKAMCAKDILLKKMKRKNLQYEDMQIDCMGLNGLHLGVADMSPEKVSNVNEVILRFAIRTKTKEEAQKLVPEIAPLTLNGPPGGAMFGGRAKVSEVISLWPTFVPRDAVKLTAHILEVK
ncbi:acyclic terpene utilization AtuA family protein [Desulfotomaculum sp. 1211_IL3151]|uniref:acyclic terpene utilization AtuA family protein n=1 Tax=Desulfotomaculum sp. 1211_IL3151 TaxID=3084055 RepID=UPI002FD8DCC6